MGMPFICKCEGKSYAGWFNNKKCKDCKSTIHNKNGIATGGYQWKTRRIKELEAEVERLKSNQ
tara:strand:+ start:142 stop:330 length:189 start_codon:yes stop_codon:yes gene_type:complete